MSRMYKATTSRRATPAPKMVATARYRRLPVAKSWKVCPRRRPAGEMRATLVAKVPASVTVKNSSRIKKVILPRMPATPPSRSATSPDNLSGIGLGRNRLQLSLADSGGLELCAQALHRRFELWLVVGEQPRQLDTGDHQDRHQADHHRVHRHQTQCRTEPGRQTMASREPAHGLDDDGEQEREKHRPDDFGERLQPQRRDQNGGGPDRDHQAPRQPGPHRPPGPHPTAGDRAR